MTNNIAPNKRHGRNDYSANHRTTHIDTLYNFITVYILSHFHTRPFFQSNLIDPALLYSSYPFMCTKKLPRKKLMNFLLNFYLSL